MTIERRIIQREVTYPYGRERWEPFTSLPYLTGAAFPIEVILGKKTSSVIVYVYRSREEEHVATSFTEGAATNSEINNPDQPWAGRLRWRENQG